MELLRYPRTPPPLDPRARAAAPGAGTRPLRRRGQPPARIIREEEGERVKRHQIKYQPSPDAGKYFYARPTKTKVGGGWTRLEECGGGGCDVGVVELREKLFNALGDDRCEIYHLRVPPPPRLLLSTTPPRSLLCLCPLFCWGV